MTETALHATLPSPTSPPSGDAPGPGAGTGSRRSGLRGWIDEGYSHHGSRPYWFIFDLSIVLILMSMVGTVLESVESVDEGYGAFLFAAECAVVLLFVLDYAANIYTARHKWRFIFGFWGIVDLLALLPFFLALILGAINLPGLRAGRTIHASRSLHSSTLVRALRALRIVRVLRLTKPAAERSTDDLVDPEHASGDDAAHQAGHSGARSSALWRDVAFGLIGVCGLITLAELITPLEHEQQLFWLPLGAVAALDLGLRRWCRRQGRRTWSWLLLALAGVMGIAAALTRPEEAEPGAAAVALATALFVVLTGVMIEFGVAWRLRWPASVKRAHSTTT